MSRFIIGGCTSPPPIINYAVQRTIPSVRGNVSLLRRRIALYVGCRNVDRLAIGCALRAALRSRLNLIRLALIQEPLVLSRRGKFLAPLCRYLYLHLLFRYLQPRSRMTFIGLRNASPTNVSF